MTELRIRNIDDWVVDLHRHNAKKNGNTLDAELRKVLTEAALAKRHALARKLEKERNELREKYGTFPSSVGYIRDMREGNA